LTGGGNTADATPAAANQPASTAGASTRDLRIDMGRPSAESPGDL
jgi:hypothetical protein